MRLGVVVPCHQQEVHLPRTLAALERSLAEHDWSGVLACSEATSGLPALSGRWRVAGPAGAGRGPRTPGAARMLGLAGCAGDWVLFVDADVEVEPAWVASALAAVAAGAATAGPGARLAGLGGRLEEWFVDARGERPGRPDLLRVGREERVVDYLTTPALYRRSALEAVGGYDVRLSSEEDFELGLRLRRAGHELRSLGQAAGRHWSGPRPSFRELARRWRSGLCFGQGQVLRIYAGRPGFGVLLRRQGLYLAALGLWTLDLAALGIGLVTGDARAWVAWAALPLVPLVPMSLRKRSPRLALHSLLTWTLHGVGLLAGLLRPLPRAREVAC
jgi:hypothetical protein